MRRKRIMIGIALVLGLFLPLEGNAQEALASKFTQRFCSPKLGLKAEGWTFFNNNLTYLMKPEPDWKIYSAELLGATVGGATGVVVGRYVGIAYIHLVLDRSIDVYGHFLFTTAAIGAAVGSTYGATITGKWLKQKGSFWGALEFSTLAAVATVVSDRLLGWGRPLPPIVIITSLAIPLGAVIGYNL